MTKHGKTQHQRSKTQVGFLSSGIIMLIIGVVLISTVAYAAIKPDTLISSTPNTITLHQGQIQNVIVNYTPNIGGPATTTFVWSLGTPNGQGEWTFQTVQVTPNAETSTYTIPSNLGTNGLFLDSYELVVTDNETGSSPTDGLVFLIGILPNTTPTPQPTQTPIGTTPTPTSPRTTPTETSINLLSPNHILIAAFGGVLAAFGATFILLSRRF